MKITVKKLDGWNQEVVVNEHTETVAHLKQTVVAALRNTQLTADHIHLIFKGEEIHKEHVRECGIKNGDTVMVVVKERKFIQIEVIHDGKQIPLFVEESESVENVKKMIFESRGFTVQEQVLMFQGTEIGGRLNHYGIRERSQIQLNFRMFNITVKAFDGRSYPMQVRLSDTVDSFMEKVKDAIHVVPAQQRLIHCGRPMQCGHLLREYNIQDSTVVDVKEQDPSPRSVVHAVSPTRGG